jgi:pSer/pThr/pTyr-binding forkhead associated (FHA) protein
MSGKGSNSYRVLHRESRKEYLLGADKLALQIGRAPGADIFLDTDGTSKRHAILTFNTGNGNAYIQDLGSTNGTTVDDRPIQGDPVSLRSGEVIQIAGNHLEILEVAGGPALPDLAAEGTQPVANDKLRNLLEAFPAIRVEARNACLVVRNLEQAGRRIDLELDAGLAAKGAQQNWTIGSDQTACKIHLPGGGVSRLHATLTATRTATGVRWKITDEIAHNKLYVNQEACVSKFLSDADRIIFGDVLVQFVLPSEEPVRQGWLKRALRKIGLG